ncbi:MAG: dienelactone hydrolase family protein [Burkholderiaceae bacterium]|nr:dienelactone hydrolase family protein [Burkholderiaceae bacterium]
MAALAAAPALAQAPNPYLAAAQQAKDLSFPDKPSAFSLFSSPEMALYKPDGPGPFPALVLHHQCGGLRANNWQNQSMLQWARTAVAHGYVALVIDSLGPRGVSSVCMGVQGGVHFPRGARDELQAVEHLRKFDFVDKKRIAVAGYSWGAMVAVYGSSQAIGAALAPGERFAAAVAFYPGCATIKPPAGNPYEIARPDIDRPLLVLMGSADNETPAQECVSRLEPAKAAGAPVEWHVYPGVSHCWDCKNLNNFSKTDVRGNQVTYRYDEAVTQDSERRMFEFLDRAMAVAR